MLGTFILFIVLYFVNQVLLAGFKKEHSFISIRLINKLYLYHIVFWLIYYLYSRSNPSDSYGYYKRTLLYETWFDAFGTDTFFIEFVAYPFITLLGFSFEAAMFMFSWFGFLGFIYFYILFRENIKSRVKLWGFDLITLLLFLPNMHFWTVSLGKGSIIFLGIGMFAYAMRVPQKRFITLLIGSLIVYLIRPHMFLFLGAGAVIGSFTGKERVPMYQKMLIYIGFIGAITLFSDQILAMANINLEEGGVLESFDEFASKRANDLSKGGSGVDMNSYSLPMKLFTFWFRPLFIDSPGALGLFVSIENVFYILLTAKILDKDFIKFLKGSSSLVKMSLTIFFTASIALSFVMANLGIAQRQKSMVMYFLFFVIIAFLEFKKQKNINSHLIKKRKLEENLAFATPIPT